MNPNELIQINNLIKQCKHNLKIIKHDISSLNLHIDNALQIDKHIQPLELGVVRKHKHCRTSTLKTATALNRAQILAPLKYDNRHLCKKLNKYTKTIHNLTSIIKMTKKMKQLKTLSKHKIIEKFQYTPGVRHRKEDLAYFKPDFTSTPTSEQPKTSTPDMQRKSVVVNLMEDKNINKKLCLPSQPHRHFYRHTHQVKLQQELSDQNQFCKHACTPNVYETHSYKARKSSYVIINQQNFTHRQAQFTEIRQTKLCFH